MDRLRSITRFGSKNLKSQALNDEGAGQQAKAELDHVTKDEEPVTEASSQTAYPGDYIDVRSHPFLMKILRKQGDQAVVFADKVMKLTGSGRMKVKRRILVITDFAIYIVDPETNALKRRIALAAVEKMCLSELHDNFFAVIIPTEYDLLLASTRKTEIINTLVATMKSTSDYVLEVAFSNKFEYNAASDLVKEVLFEEVEGVIKTKILKT